MIAIWLLSLSSILTPLRSVGPFQDLTLDQAFTAAERDSKVVMIDFFTSWRVPCKRLDKTTWTDPEVQKWLGEKTVAIRLDAEKEADLARRYRIESCPTMLFLRPDRTEIDRLVGYRKPADFLSQVKDALAGKSEVTRAKDKLIGHDPSPVARQDHARELANAAHPEEALAEYLWCFDNGKDSPGYAGVRRSFLLEDICRLGKAYPPAIKALEGRRDAAEANLIGGSDSIDDAMDAVAVNRQLNTPQRSLLLYDRVQRTKPLSLAMKRAFGDDLLGPLVDLQRYQEAVDLFDNPEDYVTQQISLIRNASNLGGLKDEAVRRAENEARQYMKEKTVGDCAKLYEALLGLDRRDVAAKVADDLIEFLPSGSTYSTLVLSAVRAPALEVARSLGERGVRALPDGEKEIVRCALATIPTSK